jgi:hypothetical protein
MYDIGLKLGTQKRAEYKISGGYIKTMALDMTSRFTEMSHVISHIELEEICEGVKHKLHLFGPRVHGLYDAGIVILAVIFGNSSKTWWIIFSLLLGASMLWYQHQLEKTRTEILKWLDIKNEATYMARQSHWQWGPEDFCISFEFPTRDIFDEDMTPAASTAPTQTPSIITLKRVYLEPPASSFFQKKNSNDKGTFTLEESPPLEENSPTTENEPLISLTPPVNPQILDPQRGLHSVDPLTPMNHTQFLDSLSNSFGVSQEE